MVCTVGQGRRKRGSRALADCKQEPCAPFSNPRQIARGRTWLRRVGDCMMESLASYHRCLTRIAANWPAFLDRRREQLGGGAERVTESIVVDLFTNVLDWSLSDIEYQVGFADLLLARPGVKKYLVLEAKRPGALAWNRRAVEAALNQARRYADEQKVNCVSVSDGIMLYAADIERGGLTDRVFVSLDSPEPHESLWWLSLHGIYRPHRSAGDAALRLLPETPVVVSAGQPESAAVLLHPKYQVPASCFAYVGDAGDPRTWKLPYCQADGTIDLRRLPKAVQAMLSNYRGVRVSGIPRSDAGEVLVRLARAAVALGKMPHQTDSPAPAYQQLAKALEQLGRLHEVTGV